MIGTDAYLPADSGAGCVGGMSSFRDVHSSDPPGRPDQGTDPSSSQNTNLEIEKIHIKKYLI